MDDLISRQAAIDAVYDAFSYAYCDNCEKDMNEDLCEDCHRKYQNWSASKKIIEKVINSLPSAQGCKYYDAESDFCALNRPAAQPEQLDTCPIYDGMCGYPSDRCYECPRHCGAKEKAMWWTLPSAQPEYTEQDVRDSFNSGYACGMEAAQPEPERTGRWQITHAYPHNVHCSVCHKRFAQTHWAVWEDGSLPRNYCPNCGAKMKEGEEHD